MTEHYIFIDPSINNIGVAVFNPLGELEDFFEITTSRTKEWRDRVLDATETLLSKFAGWRDTATVVIEFPIYFSGGRGRYAYAGEKIQKLYYAVGHYSAAFFSQGYKVEQPKVSAARKNLPEEISKRRVEKVFGQGISPSEHVLDAIYLGMWYGEKHGLWDVMS